MNAIIFAAGKGTRLGELSHSTPKALLRVGGMTLLERCVRHLNNHGFKRIIVNVHHLAEMVEEEIAGLRLQGFAIAVSKEDETLLETGGGLFHARDFFGPEPFLIYNVDIISDINLSEIYSFHKSTGNLVTLAVRKREGKRFFLIDDSGRLRGWRNTVTGEEIIPGGSKTDLIEVGFSGIHIADSDLFNHMKKGIYSLTKLYLDLCGLEKIGSFDHTNDIWIDVGTPENLEKAQTLIIP